MSLRSFKQWQVCPLVMYYVLWQFGVSVLLTRYVMQSLTLLAAGLEYYKKNKNNNYASSHLKVLDNL